MPKCLPLLAVLCITLAAQTADPLPAIGRYPLRDEPRTLDPQAAYDLASMRVISAVYDTLLEYHPLKTDSYDVRPCMLATMPKHEVSAEGRHSYLCELKPGIRFHDDPCFPDGKGRAVTASDVHYAFQRVCDPAVDAPYFAEFSDIIEGITEARAQAEKSGGTFRYDDFRVTGIEVLDAHRFRIRLRRPCPQLVYWLAMPCTTPVAREAVEFHQWTKLPPPPPGTGRLHPVGTGAFQLREHLPGKRLRFSRTPGYATTTFPADGFHPKKQDWLKPLAGKSLPLLDEVELLISQDNQPFIDAFRRGEVDSMPLDKDARRAFLEDAGKLNAKSRERGMILEVERELSTFWITFNWDDPILGKNKKLRQALACAYDARTYIQRFYDGISPVATQLLPAGIFGHDPARVNPYGFDLEKGKRLLSEAGYPDGRAANGEPLELTLLAVEGPVLAKRAEFDARQLEALGLRVRLEKLDFPGLLARRDKGEFQICTGSGWGADYPDAENFFMLFHSRNVPPDGSNSSRYRNPEFDRLFEQMAAMENSPERMAIIRQMNDLLAEDCPVIPTFHKEYQTVSQPWARPTHGIGALNAGFKFLTVDPAMRARLMKEWPEGNR